MSSRVFIREIHCFSPFHNFSAKLKFLFSEKQRIRYDQTSHWHRLEMELETENETPSSDSPVVVLRQSSKNQDMPVGRPAVTKQE
jgi:hypothetical protein